MTRIHLNEIDFAPPIFRSDLYTAYASHANMQVSKLTAILYPEHDRHVLLDEIKTLPEYRHLGISRIQVLTLLDWCRKLNMPYVKGWIGESLLLEDNATNVTKFFRELGFSVDGNNLRKDIY